MALKIINICNISSLEFGFIIHSKACLGDISIIVPIAAAVAALPVEGVAVVVVVVNVAMLSTIPPAVT